MDLRRQMKARLRFPQKKKKEKKKEGKTAYLELRRQIS
jgi:hypothetical protein